MTDPRSYRPRWLTGLSGRLLALTIAFVMLAEVLIYVPSVARFRQVYLEEQITKAHLAALALEASPDNLVTDALAVDLLMHAGARAIVLKLPARRMLMLAERMPPMIDASFDLRDKGFFDWIGDAVMTLVQRRNRILRIVDTSPRDPDIVVEVLLEEAPLRQAMYAFSWRILTLSLVISAISASLIYFVLQWWMVRPIARLTESMVRFRRNPEDERATLHSSRRSDEIGGAERELAEMQSELRAALRQKTRLATLGSAVAKIHHDLRNTLTTAVLASDQLADSDDPDVRRVAPRLYAAIDRAVGLTSRTLEYVREELPPLRETKFTLRELLADVDSALRLPGEAVPAVTAEPGAALDLAVSADRDQLFRVFSNLALNALQAGASRLEVTADPVDSSVVIDVRDNGPGIPARVRQHLFVPFAAASRSGGSGLGLVIAREIVAAHGGSLELAATGVEGTIFRIRLPLRRQGRSSSVDANARNDAANSTT
jgi:signal transduction histidine kinase